LGLVRLTSGPTVVAHVHESVPSAPADVELVVRLDESGYAVLIARARGEDTMNEDARFKQMSCDPRGLNIFVTDGTNDVGRALVSALQEAGAAQVWAASPTEPVGPIAHEVDMLVNTSRYEGNARDEMEINYFGLLRLEEAFAASMQSRAAANGRGATWVNILAVTALCGVTSQQTFSASMAAALSVSQCLRARGRAAGLRVINVLPGPISADTLAKSVISGLREGLEDIYPGEVAQEWLSRWLDSPKALERMVAG
jgi:NAD(P)-dependent dehydrogenase (short-subunit alcohol dehydrogenase family)